MDALPEVFFYETSPSECIDILSRCDLAGSFKFPYNPVAHLRIDVRSWHCHATLVHEL